MIDISKVPEIVYFATYVALSDNRLYDREWYRIDDLDAWFDSDFNQGDTLVKHRKSIDAPNFRNNGKYGR